MSFIRRNSAAIVIIALGIAFIVLGVGRGEDQTVFRKAINICMECIGLG